MSSSYYIASLHQCLLGFLKIIVFLFLITALNKNAYGFIFPNKDAYLNGMEQFKLTNYPAAAEYFETALKLDPKNKDIINALGTTYEKSLKFEKANKLYQKAILDTKVNQDEERLRYLFNSGNNFFKMQRYSEAIDEYKKLLQIDDKNTPTKKNLELAIKKLNQENKQKKQKNKSDKNSKENKKDKPKNSKKKNSESAKKNPKQSKPQKNQDKSGTPSNANIQKGQSKDENKSSINLKRANEILKNFAENQASMKGFKFYKKEKSNKKSPKNW